jgi:predicted alpha/beta hydrolase family esterase
MTNVFIIHGTYGYPGENWFPWLKSELEKGGFTVFVPKFPTPENQSLKNWIEVFEKYQKYLNPETIIIGHSLGVPFLLNVLEHLDKPVKAAYFVSGSTGSIGNPVFDKLNESFSHDFDWKKIRKNCPKIFVFHSDNDPYVPLKKSEELSKNLGVKIILVKNAGHFNEKAGYTKFELLLNYVKTEL